MKILATSFSFQIHNIEELLNKGMVFNSSSEQIGKLKQLTITRSNNGYHKIQFLIAIFDSFENFVIDNLDRLIATMPRTMVDTKKNLYKVSYIKIINIGYPIKDNPIKILEEQNMSMQLNKNLRILR